MTHLGGTASAPVPEPSPEVDPSAVPEPVRVPPSATTPGVYEAYPAAESQGEVWEQPPAADVAEEQNWAPAGAPPPRRSRGSGKNLERGIRTSPRTSVSRRTTSRSSDEVTANLPGLLMGAVAVLAFGWIFWLALMDALGGREDAVLWTVLLGGSLVIAVVQYLRLVIRSTRNRHLGDPDD